MKHTPMHTTIAVFVSILAGLLVPAALAQAPLPTPPPLPQTSTMPWTQELGEAFLAQRDGVMDAVQRMRQKAKQYGYLRSNAQITVSGGPYIEVLPVNPDYIVVPY